LPALSAPFVVGGALKIAYDIALYLNFRKIRPAEEEEREKGPAG
ncbi:MAG: MFS transporter, partial [Chloroflexota bacterium]